jgi:hypothetical protein
MYKNTFIIEPHAQVFALHAITPKGYFILYLIRYMLSFGTGADLGFFVPQSNFFGRRGVIGAGRGLDWAWSTTGGEGGVGAK